MNSILDSVEIGDTPPSGDGTIDINTTFGGGEDLCV